MRTLIRFQTATGDWAVPVEHAREVRTATGIAPLPAPQFGIAGLLRRGDEVLTVMTMLGAGNRHVLILDAGEGRFGLLVESVSGVIRVEDERITPPPAGQRGAALVNGVVRLGADMVLLVDVAELGRAVQ